MPSQSLSVPNMTLLNIYGSFLHCTIGSTTQPFRKIKLAIYNHQTDSPLYAQTNVYSGDCKLNEWPSAITMLSAHLMCKLMNCLLWWLQVERVAICNHQDDNPLNVQTSVYSGDCKFKECDLIYDAKCPYCIFALFGACSYKWTYTSNWI